MSRCRCGPAPVPLGICRFSVARWALRDTHVAMSPSTLLCSKLVVGRATIDAQRADHHSSSRKKKMSVRCGCHPGDGVAVVHSEATDKCQRTTVKSPQSVTVMSHDQYCLSSRRRVRFFFFQPWQERRSHLLIGRYRVSICVIIVDYVRLVRQS